MLRPGGILLTNTPLFQLPSIPLTQVGFTDVLYTRKQAGAIASSGTAATNDSM